MTLNKELKNHNKCQTIVFYNLKQCEGEYKLDRNTVGSVWFWAF